MKWCTPYGMDLPLQQKPTKRTMLRGVCFYFTLLFHIVIVSLEKHCLAFVPITLHRPPRCIGATTNVNDDRDPSSFTTSSSLPESLAWMYDDIPSEFVPLLTAVTETCLPRAAITDRQAHDAFRYEWGTWVNEDKLAMLMERVNQVRLLSGAYELLLSLSDENKSNNNNNRGLRYRVAGGQDWDVLLHILPSGQEWQGRWPTGSWAIVKPLTGVVEVAMLRGPNAQGLYRKATTKSLRGGGDGSLAGSKATTGDDCIKYVGGPLRSYTGKGGKPVLLEVVIRPPIFADDDSEDSLEDVPVPLEEVLAIEVPSDGDDDKEEGDEEPETDGQTNSTETSLTAKIGMNFDQVGGLDGQLNDIARRVLASRANPEAARRLGISHVKGILLSGPPGCGKTLLVRGKSL